LQQLGDGVAGDRDLLYSMVRLQILRQRFAEAEEWISRLIGKDASVALAVAIGGLYESARNDAKAQVHYQQALTGGHCPAALLGLARLANNRRETELARQHILTALDTVKPLAENVQTVYDVFQPALNQLLILEEPIASCRAWMARQLPGHKPNPFFQRTFLVYARDDEEAEGYLRTVLQAMAPSPQSVGVCGLYSVDLAPRDLQPVHLVRPGVQYVYK
jgi:hypothetical protein